MAERARPTAQPLPPKSMAREIQQGFRTHRANSPEFDSELIRPTNPEPFQQPPDQVLSLPSYPIPFMGHRAGAHPGTWYNAYGASGEPDKSVHVRSFSSQRYTSNTSGSESFYDASFPPPLRTHSATLSGQLACPPVTSRRPRNTNNAQQMMITLRDDQFGQILEALSPPKGDRRKPLHAQTQSHRPPKMGALSVPVRPSSTANTRSIPDLNTPSRNRRPSSDQTSFDMIASTRDTTSKKENRGPRLQRPISFVLESQRCDSDVSMRDSSSIASSLARVEKDLGGLGSKIGSAHAPSAARKVKSRKEGLVNDTGDFDNSSRHDQSLLLMANAPETVAHGPARTPRNNHFEVIDVDAIDPSLTADLANLSPFKPSHKAGMSSISSTGRLERQLYNALGEELGGFEQMNTNEMGSELAKALAGGSQSDLNGSTLLDSTIEFEPVVKRKRQDTLGGERDKSPAKKKERARQAMIESEEEDLPDDMPCLRGD